MANGMNGYPETANLFVEYNNIQPGNIYIGSLLESMTYDKIYPTRSSTFANNISDGLIHGYEKDVSEEATTDDSILCAPQELTKYDVGPSKKFDTCSY
ncbi:MAG: hypothetical protein K1X29_01535 [Bdellovibrionales bacterium]|nr:hypothetical protein [Bdellovibrionales bacterium]